MYSTVTQLKADVSAVQEKVYSLFTSKQADRLMDLTANKTDRARPDSSLTKNLNNSRDQISEVDISGWQWYGGNAKNFTDKLKFAVKYLRKYVKEGNYSIASKFNTE